MGLCCVYELGQKGSFSSAAFNIMQLPYSEVQHWGKPDFYFQLQNMRQKGRHTQSLARTHGRISHALLLNLVLNKGSHQNQDLFEDLENFLLGLMKNRALHELFSQAEHRAQVRLLTCWDNWVAGLRVSQSTWGGWVCWCHCPVPMEFLAFPSGEEVKGRIINLNTFATWHLSRKI